MRLGFVSLFCLVVAQAADLHDAVRVCDAASVRQLLQRGAVPDQVDAQGRTPLHVAIEARKVECVRILAEAGADRAAKDSQGKNAFDLAGQIPNMQERASISMALMPGVKSAAPTSGSSNPPWSLAYAIERRQPNVVKMLLSMGADPNAGPFLASAALKGDAATVRLLLAHGAKPEAVSAEGTLPIHDAALGGNAEVIAELAKKGADVNARTPAGEKQTALHMAAAMGKLKAVEALVALGAGVTLRDSQNRTPRQAAERAGLEEVAAYLKQAEAQR